MERLKIIDFESFRPILTEALKKERKNNAGRHPFDNVMMFKVLVLEKLFNLSDDQTEYQITDRMSFQRFLGLSLGENVPDAKTIWLFKNTLTELGIIDVLFAEFNRMLEEHGYHTHYLAAELLRREKYGMRRPKFTFLPLTVGKIGGLNPCTSISIDKGFSLMLFS